MDAAFRKLTHALMLIGGMGIVLMMAHVTLDVVLKNLFNAPIQGTIEISSYYYMVAVVMLPMAMVEYEDEQISVDLLFARFPAPLRKALLLLTFVITAAGGLRKGGSCNVHDETALPRETPPKRRPRCHL